MIPPYQKLNQVIEVLVIVLAPQNSGHVIPECRYRESIAPKWRGFPLNGMRE